jgi:predicted N-acetyltransferase YhbS
MITYKIGNDLNMEEVIDVYRGTILADRRPISDRKRMAAMFQNSNLVIAAYDDDKLIGLARCLTDFSFTTYLSDLLVKEAFQKQGIGQKMIEEVALAAPTAKIVLLAAPQARDYYPHIGFEKHASAWVKSP